MPRKIDLSGLKINRWTVLSRAPNVSNDSRKAGWNCRCDCGTERVVYGNNIKRGLTHSCGCYRIEVDIARLTTHGKSYTQEYKLFNAAKKRAKKRGLPFNITLDDVVIPEKCPVLGIKFCPDKNIRNRPSIDRLIPELGYVKGNIWVISMKANMAKSNLTVAELQKLLDCITERILAGEFKRA